jgi:hypothetical protein
VPLHRSGLLRCTKMLRGHGQAIAGPVRTGSCRLTAQISSQGRRGGRAGPVENRTLPSAGARLPLVSAPCGLRFPAIIKRYSCALVCPKLYSIEHCIIVNSQCVVSFPRKTLGSQGTSAGEPARAIRCGQSRDGRLGQSSPRPGGGGSRWGCRWGFPNVRTRIRVLS